LWDILDSDFDEFEVIINEILENNTNKQKIKQEKICVE
jgi:hypothetical protein